MGYRVLRLMRMLKFEVFVNNRRVSKEFYDYSKFRLFLDNDSYFSRYFYVDLWITFVDWSIWRRIAIWSNLRREKCRKRHLQLDSNLHFWLFIDIRGFQYSSNVKYTWICGNILFEVLLSDMNFISAKRTRIRNSCKIDDFWRSSFAVRQFFFRTVQSRVFVNFWYVHSSQNMCSILGLWQILELIDILQKFDGKCKSEKYDLAEMP